MTWSFEHIFLLILIVSIFIGFITEWVPPELLAIGGMIACIFVGILSVDVNASNNALALFGHHAPLTIACMFILSAALEKTGVVNQLGDIFERFAGSTKTQMMLVLLVFVALLSGFMNNTPVVVVFIPIVISICRSKNYAASRFLIPLSYASIAGGTMTLIGTSTNLVAASIASGKGIQFSMFDILPLGVVFVVITISYLVLFGKKILPERLTLAAMIEEDNREFITHAIIAKDSDVIGKTVADSLLAKGSQVSILEIRRNGISLKTQFNKLELQAQDEIVFKGNIDDLTYALNQEGVAVKSDHVGINETYQESLLLVEGIIGPNSRFIGKTLNQIQFRQQFGAIILAIHRKGKNVSKNIQNLRLAFGDTLFMQGSADRLGQLFNSQSLIKISEKKKEISRQKKAPIAIAMICLFAIAGVLSGNFGIPQIPVVLTALFCAFIVLITKCINPLDAYRAIDWKIIFLIIGMLSIGKAMQDTGFAANIASMVMALTANPYYLIALCYLFAAVMTELISNTAVVALLTPIVITLAASIGVDSKPFIIAVMFGSSASFSTPIGYQTNTFVYGAGGYKFKDFCKAGIPLAIILWLVASLLIPRIWHF